jgi:hypothetical protein
MTKAIVMKKKFVSDFLQKQMQQKYYVGWIDI